MAEPMFNPKEIIPAFDQFLGERSLSFSAIAIGGVALAVLGIADRGTRDLDLLETEIPDDILNAAIDFANGHGLSEEWLNAGPVSLMQNLPATWRNNLQPLYQGKNLRLLTLCRLDLIRTKFWAMCDRMRDLEDLVAIAPSEEELELAVAWVKPLDGNSQWPTHVDAMANVLRKRLRDG